MRVFFGLKFCPGIIDVSFQLGLREFTIASPSNEPLDSFLIAPRGVYHMGGRYQAEFRHGVGRALLDEPFSKTIQSHAPPARVVITFRYLAEHGPTCHLATNRTSRSNSQQLAHWDPSFASRLNWGEPTDYLDLPKSTRNQINPVSHFLVFQILDETQTETSTVQPTPSCQLLCTNEPVPRTRKFQTPTRASEQSGNYERSIPS